MTVVVSQDSLVPAPDILVAFDPGKVTGVAVFKNGQVKEMTQVPIEKFPKFLQRLREEYQELNQVYLYENFKLFKWKAMQQSGSSMEASQVIGMVKMAAPMVGADIAEQSPQIKPVAQKWSGVIPPKNHARSHEVDAYNHGVYWLISNRMRMIENGKTN